MREEVRSQLLKLNRAFYSEFAGPFTLSRANPQPGFERLLPYLPQQCERLLDAGCGEGRFGRFLQVRCPHIAYIGVDFSEALLASVRESVAGATVYRRDLSRSGSLDGLGQFDFVVCLAVLQHIPGREQRVGLLREMAERLQPGGSVALSTWQFLNSERQRRKIVPWHEAEIEAGAVEEGDYLLSWRSGGFGLRYVAYIDGPEIARLAQGAGLRVVDCFHSDGLEGDLNLYTVIAPAGSP